MLHFDDLRAELEFSAPSGSEVNELCRDLRRQAKRIGGGRAMRDHRFRACRYEALDYFFSGGGPRSKTRFDGSHVNAPVKRHQLITSCQTPQRLIDGGAAAKMQEFLSTDQSAFGERLDLLQDFFGNR
jgi:hypothetical protein